MYLIVFHMNVTNITLVELLCIPDFVFLVCFWWVLHVIDGFYVVDGSS